MVTVMDELGETLTEFPELFNCTFEKLYPHELHLTEKLGVALGVYVGIGVSVGLGVVVNVSVSVDVAVGEGVGVDVSVGVPVADGVNVRVKVGAEVRLGVCVGIPVGLGVWVGRSVVPETGNPTVCVGETVVVAASVAVGIGGGALLTVFTTSTLAYVTAATVTVATITLPAATPNKDGNTAGKLSQRKCRRPIVAVV